MEVKARVEQQPKIFLRAPFESSSGTMRIKVEINTFERSPARSLISLPYEVRSDWYQGNANVPTFELAELMATMIRALFQRRKGRDLLDLWLALTTLNVDPLDIVECFAPYRPDGYTSARGQQTLQEHLSKADFRQDIQQLLRHWPAGYDVD